MSTETQIASHLLRSRLGKLCVALTGATADEILQKANVAVAETSLLEFRLDYLPKPAAALPAMKAWLETHGADVVVATCRCKDFGGKFTGSPSQAFDILMKAGQAGFQIIDLELEAAEKLPKDAVSRLRSTGATVMISHHDFKRTTDLDALYKRMAVYEPDFMKVVPTAQKLSDNIAMLRFLDSAQDKGSVPVIGICMGEAGILSRVLGLRSGSAFTFAAAVADEATAPGQIAARTLIETYRVELIDKATKVFGVAGNPVSASMSPLMLNTAFRRETVNAVYMALLATDVDDLFKVMREVPIHGLSVTMPLKQDVIKHLERTDALSQKIGAVNTIARMPDGKFYGFNTDVAGIVGPLERRLQLRGAKVLVLGAGGAARAAVFGCADKGAEVSILNRTPETAAKLARQSGAKVIKREQLAKMSFDVIINCTPAGMLGNKLTNVLKPEELNARLFFDTVYNPIDTPLLKMARAKGLPVITGVEMFVTQGARQFEIWTGKPAPTEEMLRVIVHALRQGHETAEGGIDPTASATKVMTASVAAEKAAAAPPPATLAPVVASAPAKGTAKKVEAPKVAAKPAAPVAKVATKKPEPAPVKAAGKVVAPIKIAAKAKPAPAKVVAKKAPAKVAVKAAPKPALKKAVPAKKAPAKKVVAKTAAPAKKAVAKKTGKR
ncbi:shikimate dehydrogenase [Granulicella cerasi]|uniref:Multifunctional fusion protein n=1 Tax=Granulicella cerasi TaxID=741063 RepID=A0ABW1ZCZ9_9BACT|nr:shikimate dehydrogenase [Granulicella cerasi]